MRAFKIVLIVLGIVLVVAMWQYILALVLIGMLLVVGLAVLVGIGKLASGGIWRAEAK